MAVVKAAALLLLAAATWVCLSAAAASAAFEGVPTAAFDERFSPLFGDGNLVRSSDDRSVRLLLDRRSGSGFISSDYYLHGFFSASIKLPKDYTAGVVVAFYTSSSVSLPLFRARWFLPGHMACQHGFGNRRGGCVPLLPETGGAVASCG